MKSFIVTLIAVFLFMLPNIALGQYTIILKDGRTFETNYYWRYKGQVNFFYKGGELGFPEAKVDKVLVEKHNTVPLGAPSQSVTKKRVKAKRSTLSLNPVARISRPKAERDLKELLSQRYAGSYSTQLMLLKSGMRAYDYLKSIPGSGASDKVLNNLINRYYPHFGTIKLLYEHNMKAFRELQ